MAKSLQIVINADDRTKGVLGDLSKNLEKLRGDAEKAEPPFKALGEKFSVLAGIGATAASVVGGGLLLALGYASNKAAEFEEVMSGVGAVTGATAPELEKLTQLALGLGKETRYSATEAGRGIEELAKAGVSIADIMGGGARAALSLAAAGGLEVAAAATIASDAMNMFGLKGSDMVKVSDTIAGAANTSSIDVTQFGQALSMSGAVANLAGVSFDDLATAIALMGNAGIKGSDAGTSLKTMFMNLNPQSKEAAGLMKQLGIITADGANQFFDANGKMRDLAGVSGVLQNALSGMSQQQRVAALQTMFGSDAIRAATVLSKAGVSGFEDLAKAIGGISAADVASMRTNNLKGAIERLKSSVDSTAISVGLAFTPTLKRIVDEGLNPLFGSLVDVGTEMLSNLQPAIDAAAEKFREWEPTIIKVSQVIGDTLLVGIRALGAFLRDNLIPVAAATAAVFLLVGVPALLSLAAAGWAAAAPFLPLVAVVALVAGAVFLAFKAYQDNWFGIRDVTDTVVGWIVPFIEEQFGWIVAWFQDNWPLIQKTFETVWKATQVVFKTYGDLIGAMWKTWGFDLLAAAKFVWDVIASVINLAVKNIFGGLKLFMLAMTGDWDGFHKELNRLNEDSRRLAIQLFKLLAEGVAAQVKWLVEKAGLLFDGLKGDLVSKAQSAADGVKGAISWMGSQVAALIGGMADQGGAILSNLANLANAMVARIRSEIENRITTIRDSVANTVSGAVAAATNQVTGMTDVATRVIGTTRDAIVAGLGTIQIGVQQTVSGAVAAAINQITGMSDLAGRVISGIADGITSRVGTIAEAIRSVINSAIAGFNGRTSALSFNLGTVQVPGVGAVTFPTIGPVDLPDMPYLADGGIVRRPTVAMIGEAGPEAVVPLDRASDMGFGRGIEVHVHGLNRGVEPADVVRALRRVQLLYGV
jgi:TP901 family phage tail tape measure protein